jgi:hypothetical protein
VGPTCQTQLSVPGLPGSAPLKRGCHAPYRARALNALLGPHAVRRRPDSAAPFRPRRRRCLNRLASHRPVLTAPSPLSEAAPPPCPNPVAVQLSSAVASFIHGERRPSLPLVVSLPWSVELTFLSLLTVAGPPPATVAPPRRKKCRRRARFLPLTIDEELR